MEVGKCKLVKCPTCKEQDNILKVAQMMKRKKERSAIVVDKTNRPIGIVSAVDIIYKVLALGKSINATKAKQIMNKVHTVDASEHIVRAYLAMAKKGFMSCPVIKNNKYQGTLYMHEAVRAISKKKK